MSDDTEEKLRVLELYSGIGGMHWALRESRIPFEVVMAVDINTTANKIYQQNFPDANLNSFGIEKLTLKKLRSLQANAILMSPPCQPFSRVGNKGDCDDVRTKSFLHVLQLLQQIDVKPSYILVENVKGFEVSRTRQLLVDTLQACCYGYQEYLLTPLQFGIPNSRLRYYLIAKLRSLPHPLVESNEIFYTLPDSSACQSDNHPELYGSVNLSSSPPHTPHHINVPTCGSQTVSNTNQISNSDIKQNVICDYSSIDEACARNTDIHNFSSIPTHCHSENKGESSDRLGTEFCSENSSSGNKSSVTVDPLEKSKGDIPAELSELTDAGRNMRYCEESDPLINETSRSLSDYMEDGMNEELFQHLLVKDKDLRQFVVMDVVLPHLKKSTCFTKRYGHYVEGAGSLVQMSSSIQDTRAASCFKSNAVELKNKHDWGEEELSILRRLKLRYFSPREVANLLCFPVDFQFPQDLSYIQKYRCLGNSLNVYVVARLITLLISDGFKY